MNAIRKGFRVVSGKRGSLLIVFALVMAASVSFAASKVHATAYPETSYGDKYISESRATMTPATLASGTTPNDYTIVSAEPSQYSISSVRWYDRTVGGDLISNTTSLIYGHEYRVQFNFVAVNGYKYGAAINDSSDCLLNGVVTYTTLANSGSTLRHVDFPCGSTLETHNFTFALNGGSWTSTNPIKVSHGNMAYSPYVKPTKVNYVFDGWYKDSGLTTAFDFTSAINSNTTVYAKWVHGYKVTYNLNGGTWTSSMANPQYVKDSGSGGTVSKPSDPSREGFVFAGWYLDASFETAFDFTKKITEDKALYAKWNSPTITVANAILSPEPAVGLTLGDLTLTSADSSRYTVSPAWWKLNDSGYALADTTPIEAGQTYTLYLTYYASTGYTIPDNGVTFNVNGKATEWTGFEAIENRKISFTVPEAALAVDDRSGGICNTTMLSDGVKVTSSKACAVAVTNDGGATYTRVPAVAVDGEVNTYKFGFAIGAGTSVVVALRGDGNFSGSISIADSNMVNKSLVSPSLDMYRPLSALEAAVLDMNGSDSISIADSTLINRSLASPTLTSVYQEIGW